jgi:hypothetical protein
MKAVSLILVFFWCDKENKWSDKCGYKVIVLFMVINFKIFKRRHSTAFCSWYIFIHSKNKNQENDLSIAISYGINWLFIDYFSYAFSIDIFF